MRFYAFSSSCMNEKKGGYGGRRRLCAVAQIAAYRPLRTAHHLADREFADGKRTEYAAAIRWLNVSALKYDLKSISYYLGNYLFLDAIRFISFMLRRFLSS